MAGPIPIKLGEPALLLSEWETKAFCETPVGDEATGLVGVSPGLVSLALIIPVAPKID
jgi:hypothetical protein